MNAPSPQASPESGGTLGHASIPNGRAASLTEWLERFRLGMGGRSSGIWRLKGIHLVNLGHSFAPEVDPTVASEFRMQTAAVRLSSRDLAIVEAVVSKDTVTATVTGALQGSGRWLERLGAERSYAIPILGERTILGVVGISFTEEVDDTPELRKQLESWACQAAVHVANPGLLG